MLWVADLCYMLAGLIYLPRLVYEMVFLKKNRRGWTERLGHLRSLPPGRLRIWVHAVSLGEMNATRSLIAAIREQFPDGDVVISTTTDTGYARGRGLYPDLYVFRYALDFSWIVRRALNRLNPSLIVLVELEVWHNLSLLAARRRVPVVVFNGRLSERSRRRYRLVKALVRPMFGRLAWVGAQDATYARRFEDLGVPPERITVTGSVKYDTAPTDPNVPGVDELRAELGLADDEPLWVCGSTGPGEEEIILRAYEVLSGDLPRLRLAIVPRKPERFDEVARLIERSGYPCFRRSAPGGRTACALDQPGRPAVILGDTMGELRTFYALASVVLVGRSLVPMGGSDVIEAAALAKPLLVGPHVENFADAVEQLRLQDGLRVTTPERVSADVKEILNYPELARSLSANARSVVRANLGATDRTLMALLSVLSAQAT
ncbi:MAG: 3-deoxy-D-manno-octulosonic acid transferase [Phycisphaerales bacterium]|nr:MAG: 3-deoxy-D-manno-octulosonic acid transferase [Phycisphaerales bacterium]